ncbi:MAG: VWA domain-containing protein [Oscillospiraceae bacterium]
MPKIPTKISEADLQALIEKIASDDNKPHVPVCILLDKSSSMGELVHNAVNLKGELIESTRADQLNLGLKRFINSLISDKVARVCVDLNFISFGTYPEEMLKYSYIRLGAVLNAYSFQDLTIKPERTATGLGRAVDCGLNSLIKRKQEMKDKHLNYYQPWLVLMTDGDPWNDDDALRLKMQKEVRNLVANRKLNFIPVAIGDGSSNNFAELRAFTPDNSIITLQGTDFTKFFDWLSASLSISSKDPSSKINQFQDFKVKKDQNYTIDPNCRCDI